MTEYRRSPPSSKGAPPPRLAARPIAKPGAPPRQTAGVLDDGGVASHLSARTLEI